MTLPANGFIHFASINYELGRDAAHPISLGEAPVRALACNVGGPISFADLHGKTRGNQNIYVGAHSVYRGYSRIPDILGANFGEAHTDNTGNGAIITGFVAST